MQKTDTYPTARTHPLQARGKERVRVILAAALKLITAHGLEAVTTNDIAKAAGIPIGSLYRYYPNKDAILQALVALYMTDLSKLFDAIARHPFFLRLSWNEILLLIVDAWVGYVRLNGSFPLLHAEKVAVPLHAKNEHLWADFTSRFAATIRKRCSFVSDKELQLCFQFCFKAAEMGVFKEYQKVGGPHPHHEAVEIVAAYMNKVCLAHQHEM